MTAPAVLAVTETAVETTVAAAPATATTAQSEHNVEQSNMVMVKNKRK